MVRALVGEMLREMGFAVCEASSAKAALVVLKKGPPITTLVTDIRMPESTGLDLAAEVSRTRPGIRIIYMTAYAKEAAMGSNLLLRHDVLIKPFSFEQLQRVLTEKARAH